MATGAVLSMGMTSVAYANYAGNACCPPPPCDPCGSWCDNFAFEASWLYWKVNGDAFDFAVVKERRTTPDAQTIDFEDIHDIKFGWDNGFRIAAGFDVPNWGWGICLSWTHFDTSSSKKHQVVGSGTGLTTFVAFPAVDNAFGTIGVGQDAFFRASENFRYNVVDLEFGKWLCCGCSALMFRPHVGLRFADIHDSFKDELSFLGTGAEATYPTDAVFLHFHNKNRFKGVGIRAGLDLDFRLCDGWSIVGRGAGSLVWGRTHLKNNFDYDTAALLFAYDSEIKEHYRNTKFITDLALGIRFKTLACDCYPLTIELAWEQHYIFNQHQYWVDDSYFPNTTPFTSTATTSWKKKGDVGLQGLTLTAGFDF